MILGIRNKSHKLIVDRVNSLEGQCILYGQDYNQKWRSCILSNRVIKQITQHDISLDNIDHEIIALLCAGNNNRQISTQLKIPLSTIQRRTRNIISSGIVNLWIQPNFQRLGLKRGSLHIDLDNGDIRKSVTQLSKMDGMISSSVQIGNSDVVAEYAYENTERLMDTITNIKHMEGVAGVKWSEEVYRIPVTSEDILSSFKKIWNNGNNHNGYSSKKNSKYNNSKQDKTMKRFF
jgi:DNA-binding Lrp family transcriptional regulator